VTIDSEHDPEQAQLVGQVVLAATTLDYFTCHLIAVTLGDTDKAWKDYWAQSGEKLIKGLELAGEQDERVKALVSPMKSVVQRRNQVVHGLWFVDPERGPGAYELVRPLLKAPGDSDDRGFSLDDLRLLHQHIRTLDSYVYVVWQNGRPGHQYGTSEPLDPMPLVLPSLDGIAEYQYPDAAQ
jgi:hypothetical protein